ncbi:hypothetical protein [Acetobacter pomorum]|uniref:hypothetical protein n=1 Tax=Acetobacter pomorum TaxID=65959 RepID=UPI000BC31379|nr:hypothetical protein [Acetobacter pomorum]ATI13584.1 hypothetical protein CPF11_13965 [Acetobacter pomorum]
MTRFIEEHRQTYGVGSICRVLSIAPSAYYATVARQKNPCVRSQKDKELCDDIRRRGNLTEGLYIGLDYEKVCFVEKKFP